MHSIFTSHLCPTSAVTCACFQLSAAGRGTILGCSSHWDCLQVCPAISHK